MTANVECTSCRLFEIIEDGAVFSPANCVNQHEFGKFMEIEHSSDDEDGTYPLVMHYVTLANKIDSEGASAWLNNIGGKNKLKIDIGYCTIERKSKWDNEATLKFKTPIQMEFGSVGEELILREVSEIEGEFTYEWWWMKKGRQNKIANAFTIWFNCIKFKQSCK